MCELCVQFKEVQHARIFTDGGQKFEGELCSECRTGRELCLCCNFLKPSHGLHCPAGPTARPEGT